MISAVLDACVLIPSVLADTLLRCAEDEHYRPLWSAEILAEVRRNLPATVDAAAAARRIAAMRNFFPDAEVDGYQALVGGMTNHHKDRRVLAAAVAAQADFVVTANLRDFPAAALEPHTIEAVHPDDFSMRPSRRVTPQVGGDHPSASGGDGAARACEVHVRRHPGWSRRMQRDPLRPSRGRDSIADRTAGLYACVRLGRCEAL